MRQVEADADTVGGGTRWRWETHKKVGVWVLGSFSILSGTELRFT